MTKAQLRAHKALRKERYTLARLISELEAEVYERIGDICMSVKKEARQ